LGDIRTSITQLSVTGAIQDPSINQLINYNTVQDAIINTLPTSSAIDNSLNNYYLKTAIDSSINSLLGSYATTTSLNAYYTKTATDASINSVLASYYTKSATDSSINSLLGSYATTTSLNAYYTKTAADASINSVLGAYSTISYVDGRFTNLTGIAPSSLDTLAEIAQALQSDASFGVNVYQRIDSADASINTIRSSVNGLSSTYYLKTAIDSSLNTNFYNKSYIDTNLISKASIDSSLNNYYLKTVVDTSINSVLGSYTTTSSLNNNYYTKSATDASINSVLASYYTKSATDASINSVLSLYATTLSLNDYATTTSLNDYATTLSLNDYATTTSLNDYATTTSLNNYYTKTAADASINSTLSLYATTSSLINYYTKTATDASINSALSSYTTTSSLNNNYYTKSATDSSINSVLGAYSTISYVDNRFTNITGVAPAQLDTLAEIAAALQSDASFGFHLYERIDSTDSSLNTIRSTVDNFSTTYYTKSNIDTSINSVLSAYLRSGSSNDISLNGNVQLGNGTRSIGINKLPTAAFAIDISGSTNMSGNLALTTSSTVPMGSFDLSSVNMSVFNVSEKFITVTLSTTPTLDYRTGGIFYMSGVNAAITTISITNVPTTLNRSISVTLLLAQTGGAGTNCFTTGTLNINGSSVTYLRPDSTALAAPSSSRALIINQFIIVWTGATPTVLAYLSSLG
jgi:hypothetical protein